MRLDLSDWSERRSYFIGRYYELHLQLLLSALLRPGDRVLDVGANIGMITLCAADEVGEHGLVESFEPNPACLARLDEHIRLNGLGNVVVHPVGLSSEPASMKLRVQANRDAPSPHSGTGTLADVRETATDVIVGEYDVEVRRGDDIVFERPDRPVRLIKIDVEGFELNVLKGLRRTLERWMPMVVTEFMQEHLTRAGTSRDELMAWMTALGYRPYAVFTRRSGMSHRLCVLPADDAQRAGTPFTDILWLRDSDADATLLQLNAAT
jgi:FkbM family methyltransferase